MRCFLCSVLGLFVFLGSPIFLFLGRGIRKNNTAASSSTKSLGFSRSLLIIIGVVEVSVFISVDLLLCWRTGIGHGNVVGSWSSVSRRGVGANVFRTGVAIRRGSILSAVRLEPVVLLMEVSLSWVKG